MFHGLIIGTSCVITSTLPSDGGGGGGPIGEDRNAFSVLAWNRPYVVMLPSSGLETEPVQRLLEHAYADE